MRLCFTLSERIAVTSVALALWQVLAAQSPNSCVGLHAGISAQMTESIQNGDPRLIITFVLLNDSETERAVAFESWKLVIDGNELKDSGYLFGNGPGPIGGYRTLATGSTFNFGKALPIAKYFPEQREYRISWKGRYFQSPTVTVRIPVEKN